MGALVLENNDFIKLKETIESVKVPLQPPVRINISDSGYSEFFVALETASDSLIITIKYYRD